jgi:hypothetical protein
MKLVFVTALALLVGSGSAHATTVEKKRDMPGEASAVWALIGDFCAIKIWHPLVANCVLSRQGDATYRSLTFRDGSTAKEKLTAVEETAYSYEIVETKLPIENCKATLAVEEDEDYPDRSEVHWPATFDAQNTSQEDAKRGIAEFLEAGVRAIKTVAIEADDKRQGHQPTPSDAQGRDSSKN